MECVYQLPNYHLECKIYPWDTYLMVITYRSLFGLRRISQLAGVSSWYLMIFHGDYPQFKEWMFASAPLTII